MAKIGKIKRGSTSYDAFLPASSGGTPVAKVGIKTASGTQTVGFIKSKTQDAVNLFVIGTVGYMAKAKPATGDTVVGTIAYGWNLPIIKVAEAPAPTPTPAPVDVRPAAATTRPRVGLIKVASTWAPKSGQTYSGLDLSACGQIGLRGISNVKFIDCLIDAHGTAQYGFRCDDGEIDPNERIFDHCEIRGMTSAAVYGGAFTAIACYVHDSAGDGFKPTHNAVIQGCYVTRLGMSVGSHADGVQIRDGHDIQILGNFFDMPTNVAGTNSNSSLFLQLDSRNVTFSGNWCLGGNYTVCAYPDVAPKTVSVTGNTFYTGSPRYGFGNLFDGVIWEKNVTDSGKTATTGMK